MFLALNPKLSGTILKDKDKFPSFQAKLGYYIYIVDTTLGIQSTHLTLNFKTKLEHS